MRSYAVVIGRQFAPYPLFGVLASLRPQWLMRVVRFPRFPPLRCLRCGHEPCPCCEVWCDVLLHDETDDGVITDSERDENGRPIWPALCCGGECIYTEGGSNA